MKDHIRKSFIFLGDIPESFQGDKVDISISVSKEDYPFPTFEFEIKEEYLDREQIYESEDMERETSSKQQD